MFTYVLVGLIGILAGGLVNVLADDLPLYRRPRLPRYPDGTLRPVSAWLGITAFLTGQRFSASGSGLTWRYPLAEISTACLMLLTLALKSDDPRLSGLQLVFWLIYMAIFVLITVIDIEHRLILFSVIIPAALLAVLDAIVTPTHQDPNIERALLGGLLGFGVFFILYLGGGLYVYLVNRLQGRGLNEIAFGYGDVMLSGLSGLILGLEATIFAMFITVFLGAFGALLYIVGRSLAGKRYIWFTALPYGPYIVAGTIIMMLFSAQVRYLVAGY
jgi:leader peptidase (prepilin peptidase)/N-methyltransferase